MKLDKKDREILYQLDLDARQSLNKLAKRVGISKQVAGYRIRRFSEAGIIRGFYTILDMARLGFLVFRLYVRFRNTSPVKEREIIDYLISIPEAGWVASSSGKWDVNVALYIRSISEFDSFMNGFLSKYRDYIQDKEVSIVLEGFQFRRAYIRGDEKDESVYDVIFSGSPPAKLDERDINILKLIAPEGRIESKELASKSGMVAKTAANRIKELRRKKVIQSFRVLLDLGRLGYEYYKVFLYLHNFTRENEKRLFSFLRRHPNIVYATKSVGRADYEFDLQVRNSEEFRRVMDEVRTEFTDIIGSYEWVLYYKEHKFLYFPVS